MHDGLKIQLGDKELVMPRLTVGILKKHWPALSGLNKRIGGDASPEDWAEAAPEVMSSQVAILHAALRRNYPDLTLEEVEDELELGQIGPLFSELMRFSNLEKKSGASTGEAASPAS